MAPGSVVPFCSTEFYSVVMHPRAADLSLLRVSDKKSSNYTCDPLFPGLIPSQNSFLIVTYPFMLSFNYLRESG